MELKASHTPYFSRNIDTIIKDINTSYNGLSSDEALTRLKTYGPNAIPKSKAPGLIKVFCSQFASPLVYILIIAALFSVIIHEYVDAMFICAVLVVNAIIGTIQEFSAEKAAEALQQMSVTKCRVLRDNNKLELNSEKLVPGDIVYLESGDKVPADLRLIQTLNTEIDESLLTGESLAVLKDSNNTLKENTNLGERYNMAYAGSLVTHGRAKGIVVATALNTEIGNIATHVLGKAIQKSPLIIRMEKFTNKVALVIFSIALLIAAIAFMRSIPPHEIFMLVVALAVSAIPEGLPVAITIALATSMRRMAKRNVIVRQLVAVEALGSCTYIASDKTGTLTQNKLNVQYILFPDNTKLELQDDPIEGENENTNKLIERLYRTAVLANEASLHIHNDKIIHHGDATDVALLLMAFKNGITRNIMLENYSECAFLPFESSYRVAASLNQHNNQMSIHVKGALEKLLPMCSYMACANGDMKIDVDFLKQQANLLASQGYRVLGLASGNTTTITGTFNKEHLCDLTFLGLVAIIDPLRPQSKRAVKECKQAGVKVAMITGDHPSTAGAIAEQLNLTDNNHYVVTGDELHKTDNDFDFDRLVADASVFARIEPRQKLEIVESLQRNGHFVAVSGDGANDAPALRTAEVGVAMGKNGTDLAKEASKLIITDDNFSSIVAGIEEGRIAYSNIRKVIFLLISTGAAELVLFTLALITNLPIPLLAVQLLWLNLVTNGIQDVALAFEPGEGNEMLSKPRSPKEQIFNKIMIERILVSALFMGIAAFTVFQSLLNSGMEISNARNTTLLLMVLFENVHVFNCRSEVKSVFKTRFFSNPLLIIGTITAQLIHIAAMYLPGISSALKVSPVDLYHWLEMLVIAFSLLFVMEVHKWLRSKWPFKSKA